MNAVWYNIYLFFSLKLYKSCVKYFYYITCLQQVYVAHNVTKCIITDGNSLSHLSTSIWRARSERVERSPSETFLFEGVGRTAHLSPDGDGGRAGGGRTNFHGGEIYPGGLRVPKGWRQRSQVIEWGREEAVSLQPPWVFNQLIHFNPEGSPASIEPRFFLYYAVDAVRRIEIEGDTSGIYKIFPSSSCTIDLLISSSFSTGFRVCFLCILSRVHLNVQE